MLVPPEQGRDVGDRAAECCCAPSFLIILTKSFSGDFATGGVPSTHITVAQARGNKPKITALLLLLSKLNPELCHIYTST